MGGLCRTDPRPAARPPGAPDKSPLRKIRDDFLMDTGLKQKDADYYSRMKGRTEAAKTEQERLKEKRSRERRRERAEAAATPAAETPVEETPVTETPVEDTTPEVPEPPVDFTEVVEPEDTAADTTYKGGEVEVGDVVDNRVVTSKTEAEAIESTGRGRRSTIATSPKGLLGTGEPGTVRKRRSLMGGGLIR